jgi:hypothetical protein
MGESDAMNPEIQMALNMLLHESSVEGIEIDTDALHAVCTLELTREPQSGLAPPNPCTLQLRGVTCVRVALVNEDGTTPRRGMTPIPIGSLNLLIRQFNHPQQGTDFIDSSRDDITRGLPVVNWVGHETVAPHTLTFFYGVQSREGQRAILLVRLWFDSFDLRSADGQSIDLDPYFDADALSRAGIRVIKVPSESAGVSLLPKTVPANIVDGARIALLFVDPNKMVKASATGKGVWDGRELKWLSPAGTLYDLPTANQIDIRPALPEWTDSEHPMGGFAFWTTVEVAAEDLPNGRRLVSKYLRLSAAARPRLDS